MYVAFRDAHLSYSFDGMGFSQFISDVSNVLVHPEHPEPDAEKKCNERLKAPDRTAISKALEYIKQLRGSDGCSDG
jgi:hypothetical protein